MSELSDKFSTVKFPISSFGFALNVHRTFSVYSATLRKNCLFILACRAFYPWGACDYIMRITSVDTEDLNLCLASFHFYSLYWCYRHVLFWNLNVNVSLLFTAW